MFSKNIGYHTRLDSDNTVRVCGGSFGGSLDSETVERLVNAHFTITIKNSGRPVFVDNQGRQVNLYLSVDPIYTKVGRLAVELYNQELYRQEQAYEEEKKELMNRIDSIGHDVLRKLLDDAGL